MKVLFYVGYPLAWAKGGHAVQIRQTEKALNGIGIETQWLHHESETVQAADLIHYWTRPPNDFHWQLARKSGLKIVISDLHPLACQRGTLSWHMRALTGRVLPFVLGQGLYGTLGLGVYPQCDAAIADNCVGKEYMTKVLGTPAARTYFVTNGADDVFFDSSVTGEDFDGLIYLGYICARKNSIEVARAARDAKIPVRFVGGAVTQNDPYVKEFADMVDNRFVFWEGMVNDARRVCSILKGARGSFLASKDESQPIVIVESLACGTPVMAPRMNNIKATYGDEIRYCSPPGSAQFAAELQAFYADCSKGLKQHFKVLSWRDVAEKISGIYRSI